MGRQENMAGTTRWTANVGIAFVALMGCDAGGFGTPCDSTRDCPGLVCDIAAGQCVECVTMSDCFGEDEICHAGRCEILTACMTSRQCPEQVCDVTAGYCVDCLSEVDCARGERCREGSCVISVDAGRDAAVRFDAGPRDAGPPFDAGPGFDAGPRDAALGFDAGNDAGPRDGGRDAGPRDAGPRDAGPRDAGPFDGAICIPGRVGADQDGDGALGGPSADCNDCDPAIGPGAYDYPGDGLDNDCQGGDASALGCDSGIAIDSTTAAAAARTIGLCQTTTAGSARWGVLDSRYTRASGTGSPTSALQHGVVPNFGVVAPQEGVVMLALSSGVARASAQANYTVGCDNFDAIVSDPWPSGIPVTVPTCPSAVFTDAVDPIALEVQIRVPVNARAFSFRSNFFTYDFPTWVCNSLNDPFVTVMLPRPAGLLSDNIVVDSAGGMITVNSPLIRTCAAGTYNGIVYTCPAGTAGLAGTGFQGGGTINAACASDLSNASTGWLETSAPVTPGSTITLRFTIFDSGDGIVDSSVLLDGFRWYPTTRTVNTITVP